jgi:hypothetical protein
LVLIPTAHIILGATVHGEWEMVNGPLCRSCTAAKPYA